MNNIEQAHSAIYDHFHASQQCQNFFFSPNNDLRYSGYYTSMHLIQDTCDGVWKHREIGFSINPLIAYIEFWGVMQAIFIQQDAISELFNSITGCELDVNSLPKWMELRELRNICTGHPSKKDRPRNAPITRTFMARGFGDYKEFTYEKWESPDKVTHPRVRLSELLDAYAKEATEVLERILTSMQSQWPK